MIKGKQVPVAQLQWRTYSQWQHQCRPFVFHIFCHALSPLFIMFLHLPGSHVIPVYTQQFSRTWRVGVRWREQGCCGKACTTKSYVCTFCGYCARLTSHMLRMFSGSEVWCGYWNLSGSCLPKSSLSSLQVLYRWQMAAGYIRLE